ncbi:transcriptional regulator [Enterobacter kobei]|uniref:helix-turn-helix domain-containing protein n=1 Tax=Enterobacter kobei TaxID=208224 RepID=UPI003D6F66E3
MNARDKMLAHLETSKPTSSSEFHALTRAPKSRVNQILKELLESGHIEIDSQINDIKRYRITSLHNKRRQTILDYLDDGNEGTSGDISAATGVCLSMTTQILASLNKRGEVYREWLGREKVWMYRKNSPHKFGCANPLTAFINMALREVRAA